MTQVVLFNYPTAAYVSGSETSFEAARSIDSQVNRLCRLVLDAIEASPQGMTCDEAEQLLGLSHQSCSARFTDLKSSEPAEIIKCRLPDGTFLKRKTRSGRRAFVWIRNQEVVNAA